MMNSMVLSQVFKISALLTFGLGHSLLWGQGEGIGALGILAASLHSAQPPPIENRRSRAHYLKTHSKRNHVHD